MLYEITTPNSSQSYSVSARLGKPITSMQSIGHDETLTLQLQIVGGPPIFSVSGQLAVVSNSHNAVTVKAQENICQGDGKITVTVGGWVVLIIEVMIGGDCIVGVSIDEL
jgi:hypothetical protein